MPEPFQDKEPYIPLPVLEGTPDQRLDEQIYANRAMDGFFFGITFIVLDAMLFPGGTIQSAPPVVILVSLIVLVCLVGSIWFGIQGWQLPKARVAVFLSAFSLLAGLGFGLFLFFSRSS